MMMVWQGRSQMKGAGIATCRNGYRGSYRVSYRGSYRVRAGVVRWSEAEAGSWATKLVARGAMPIWCD